MGSFDYRISTPSLTHKLIGTTCTLRKSSQDESTVRLRHPKYAPKPSYNEEQMERLRSIKVTAGGLTPLSLFCHSNKRDKTDLKVCSKLCYSIISRQSPHYSGNYSWTRHNTQQLSAGSRTAVTTKLEAFDVNCLEHGF